MHRNNGLTRSRAPHEKMDALWLLWTASGQRTLTLYDQVAIRWAYQILSTMTLKEMVERLGIATRRDMSGNKEAAGGDTEPPNAVGDYQPTSCPERTDAL